MKKEPARKCVGFVTDRTGSHSWSCRNPATHGDYCGFHLPEKQAERAARSARTKEIDVALGAVLDAARAIADVQPESALVGASLETCSKVFALCDAIREYDLVGRVQAGKVETS